MSAEPRPIKVTNLADETINGDQKAIANSKTGTVTAVVVVMYLNGKSKINFHKANSQKKILIGTEQPLVLNKTLIIIIIIIILLHYHQGLSAIVRKKARP
jgi:hypothetical protein